MTDRFDKEFRRGDIVAITYNHTISFGVMKTVRDGSFTVTIFEPRYDYNEVTKSWVLNGQYRTVTKTYAYEGRCWVLSDAILMAIEDQHLVGLLKQLQQTIVNTKVKDVQGNT